jgi:hypothetical protein
VSPCYDGTSDEGSFAFSAASSRLGYEAVTELAPPPSTTSQWPGRSGTQPRGRVLLNPTRSAGAAQTGAAFSARPHPGGTSKNPKTAAKNTAERERRDILNDRLIAEDSVGNIVDLSLLHGDHRVGWLRSSPCNVLRPVGLTSSVAIPALPPARMLRLSNHKSSTRGRLAGFPDVGARNGAVGGDEQVRWNKNWSE